MSGLVIDSEGREILNSTDNIKKESLSKFQILIPVTPLNSCITLERILKCLCIVLDVTDMLMRINKGHICLEQCLEKSESYYICIYQL